MQLTRHGFRQPIMCIRFISGSSTTVQYAIIIDAINMQSGGDFMRTLVKNAATKNTCRASSGSRNPAQEKQDLSATCIECSSFWVFSVSLKQSQTSLFLSTTKANDEPAKKDPEDSKIKIPVPPPLPTQPVGPCGSAPGAF